LLEDSSDCGDETEEAVYNTPMECEYGMMDRFAELEPSVENNSLFADFARYVEMDLSLASRASRATKEDLGTAACTERENVVSVDANKIDDTNLDDIETAASSENMNIEVDEIVERKEETSSSENVNIDAIQTKDAAQSNNIAQLKDATQTENVAQLKDAAQSKDAAQPSDADVYSDFEIVDTEDTDLEKMASIAISYDSESETTKARNKKTRKRKTKKANKRRIRPQSPPAAHFSGRPPNTRKKCEWEAQFSKKGKENFGNSKSRKRSLGFEPEIIYIDDSECESNWDSDEIHTENNGLMPESESRRRLLGTRKINGIMHDIFGVASESNPTPVFGRCRTIAVPSKSVNGSGENLPKSVLRI